MSVGFQTMPTSTAPWETRLIDLAYQGLADPAPYQCEIGSDYDLATAYAVCRELTRAHSHTFYMASGLLPKAKRHAARALYAFCRTSDDLVDLVSTTPGPGFAEWRRRAITDCPSPTDSVALAWYDTRSSYHIPRLYAEQLLNGVARDLVQTRYRTFEDLTAYCYAVAATVGLMAMHIVGFGGPQAIPYAVKLGVALQLTNILRDVAEDWRAGRLYLPQEDLERFTVTEADIASGQVSPQWRRLMRFEIDRVRSLYAESKPGLRLLHTNGRFAIAAAAEFYQDILTDIEAHDMDVFHRRSHTTTWAKLRRLPGIWWRSAVNYSVCGAKRTHLR